MGVLALDLNDIGLRVARADRDGLLDIDDGAVTSPGFAVVDGGSWTTGLAAERQCRRRPLEVRSRFWDRLDIDPIDPKQPHGANRAEVACAHLAQVMAGVVEPGDELVIAVPDWYDTRTLGLVVAMADELDLPLVALVPRAVGIAWPAAGHVVFVDLGLHRCAVSMIEVGEQINVVRTAAIPDVGGDGLVGRWMRVVRDEFVRSTRFDPLHDARSEQELHDRVPELLASVAATGSDDLALTAGATTHRITVTDAMLTHAGHEPIVRLCGAVTGGADTPRPASVVLSHEAGLVPGLVRALSSQLGLSVRSLGAGTAARDLAVAWPGCFDRSSTTPGVGHYPARRVTPAMSGADTS